MTAVLEHPLRISSPDNARAFVVDSEPAAVVIADRGTVAFEAPDALFAAFADTVADVLSGERRRAVIDIDGATLSAEIAARGFRLVIDGLEYACARLSRDDLAGLCADLREAVT